MRHSDVRRLDAALTAAVSSGLRGSCHGFFSVPSTLPPTIGGRGSGFGDWWRRVTSVSGEWKDNGCLRNNTQMGVVGSYWLGATLFREVVTIVGAFGFRGSGVTSKRMLPAHVQRGGPAIWTAHLKPRLPTVLSHIFPLDRSDPLSLTKDLTTAS